MRGGRTGEPVDQASGLLDHLRRAPVLCSIRSRNQTTFLWTYGATVLFTRDLQSQLAAPSNDAGIASWRLAAAHVPRLHYMASVEVANWICVRSSGGAPCESVISLRSLDVQLQARCTPVQ